MTCLATFPTYFNNRDLFTQYACLVSQVVQKLSITDPLYTEGQLELHGYIGLIEAIEQYTPELGLSFKTYALIQIQAKIIAQKGYTNTYDSQ